jgi:hypothetical protein
MGCWNKTCGLTTLPIMSGERTYVFVLERVKEITDHCYSTHLYSPLLLPFESTYNDYGGGEDSGGPAFQLIMDAIKRQLVEMPVGENQYHDIAVSREAWGEELFFESIHEDRLRVNYRHDGGSEVSFVMMRKDVIDDLLETYEFEEYVGEGKGTRGYKNSYERYRFADLVAGIDPLLDAAERIMKEEKWGWPRLDMVVFRYLEEPNTKNRAAAWLRNDESYRYSSIVMVRSHIVELLKQGDRETARELLIEHLKAMFVNTFMEITRKSWIPGSNEGSQQEDFKPYRALISAMNKAMDARDSRYAEEYGDDDGDEDA